MYTNRKRSENDQYNETSNHRQMKGYGGSGGSPRPRGSQPWAAAAAPFHLYMVWCLIVLIVFTSFSICIHFILCFQCVFDLYFLLYFPYFYFLCFFLYFLFFVFLYLFPRYTFWYQGPLLLIVYYPYKWNIAICFSSRTTAMFNNFTLPFTDSFNLPLSNKSYPRPRETPNSFIMDPSRGALKWEPPKKINESPF